MATLFLNDFYTIRSKKTDPGNNYLQVQVHINRDHALFTGHFPDHPVVPGVVMIQMITEILSDSLQEELDLKELTRVKFLSLVDPGVHPFLAFDLTIKQEDMQCYQVNAEILLREKLVMKCNGRWKRTTVN